MRADVVVATAGLLLSASVAHAQDWSLYQGYTTTYTVPYISSFKDAVQNNGSLQINLSLNGSGAHPFLIDTGSTGLAINATSIPGFTSAGTQGWIYYNSSGLLLQGVFNTVTVGFLDGEGHAVATAQSPVLGVTGRSCLFANLANPPTCNGDPTAPVSMLGVGVGRNTMGVGAIPGSVSDPSALNASLNAAPPISQSYNPFVNVSGMGSSTMSRGFILTPQGVQLGLTAANTAGFAYQQLLPQDGTVAGQTTAGVGNWQAATMAVAVNGGAFASGTFLPDTGLTHGYLYTPNSTAAQAVAPGAQISLQLLGAGSNVGYSFVVGDTSNPQAPGGLDWTASKTGEAFINSTLHTFAGFNYLFDAASGFLGLSLNNAFPGQTSAFLTPVLAANGTLSLDTDFAIGIATYIGNAATVSTSATATFNAGVMGPGSLTIAGPGTVVLNSDNNYAGGTTVQQGTLIANGSLVGAMTVLAGASFQNAGTYNAGASAFTNAGTFVNSGTVVGTLVNSGSATNTATGTINGSVQNGGTFDNNGVVTGTLTNSGTLTGNGTQGSLVSLPGSTISPGHSIGLIRVTGNATMAPGVTHVAEVGADGTADLILVGGTATIAGSVVRAVAMPGFEPTLGAAYPILIAGGGIVGTYASLQGGLFSPTAFPFLSTSLAYSPNAAFLVVGRSDVAYAAAALTPNQAAVATALDTLPAVSSLAITVARLNTQTAPLAFQTLSGSIYASAESVLQQQSSYLRDALTGRLRDSEAARPGRAAPTLPGFTATVWGAGFGGWGSSRDGVNANSVDRSVGGFVAGVDAPLGDVWRVGVAGGYSQSTFKGNDGGSSGSIDSYDVAAYGSGRFGAVGVRLGAAYTWHDLAARRTVIFPGFSGVGGAGYDGHTAQVFGEASYAIDVGPGRLDPYVGLAYVNVGTDAFAEASGPAALAVRSAQQSNVYSSLGLRSAWSTVLGTGLLTARATVAWQHAFGDMSPDAVLAFGASTPFAVSGVPIARNAALLGARLEYAATERLTLSIAYDGQLARGVRENAVKGTIAYRF